MSVYTTQLRWPVEYAQNSAGVTDRNDFSPAYHMLGLDDYPIFDETYRSTLNDKIIRHYYFKEIGFETIGQFAWFMRATMNERMPYFNQLYESQNLVTDPLTNRKYTWRETYELSQDTTTHDESSRSDASHAETDIDETDELTHGRTNNTISTLEYGHTVTSENSGSDRRTEGGVHERVISSDTPMNELSTGYVEDGKYATNVTYTDKEGTSAGETEYGGKNDLTHDGEDTTTVNSTDGGKDTTKRSGGRESNGTINTSGESDGTKGVNEDGTREHVTSGYDGVTAARLLKEWRETFLNIDLQVIESLDTLFMGVWM